MILCRDLQATSPESCLAMLGTNRGSRDMVFEETANELVKRGSNRALELLWNPLMEGFPAFSTAPQRLDV